MQAKDAASHLHAGGDSEHRNSITNNTEEVARSSITTGEEDEVDRFGLELFNDFSSVLTRSFLAGSECGEADAWREGSPLLEFLQEISAHDSRWSVEFNSA